jgi:hypothetical protein
MFHIIAIWCQKLVLQIKNYRSFWHRYQVSCEFSLAKNEKCLTSCLYYKSNHLQQHVYLKGNIHISRLLQTAYPPSDCIYVSQFFADTNNNLIYGFWRLVSCFWWPLWCTLNFREPHRNKSDGFKSGDWAGKAIDPPLPVHLLSAKMCSS